MTAGVPITQEMALNSAPRFRKYAPTLGTAECWEWQGARRAHGYGHFYLKDETGKNRWTTATRVAWVLATGQPLDALTLICHHCDNPPCVNPGHLYAGTHQDNSDDARVRFRNNFAERNGVARLTYADASRIRDEYAAGCGSMQGLAQRYNVSASTIHGVVHFARYTADPHRDACRNGGRTP